MTTVGRPDETLWRLELNGRRVAHGTHSGGQADALAAGRLLSIGAIRRRTDLIGIRITNGRDGIVRISARVDPERAWLAEQERRHGAERGCGLMHAVLCDSTVLQRERRLDVPDADRFPALFRSLFEAATKRHPDGGVHAAALTDGTALLCQLEDVGRHNAVEKVVGRGLLDAMDLGSAGLVLSARVSGQIAWSAARAGVAWIASRSVATTLAEAVARSGGLPIIERAASPDARLIPSAGRVR